MSASTVITGGFGASGSASLIITDGFSLGAPIASTIIIVLPTGTLCKKITDSVYIALT